VTSSNDLGWVSQHLRPLPPDRRSNEAQGGRDGQRTIAELGSASRTLLLRIDEVCAQLSLSRASVYRLVGAGLLPSVTLGRSRRIVQADLDDFVADLAAGRKIVPGRGGA